LSPTSPCELSEREVTSPSHLKVVGALDNYSLVFVIFINFFGQLKDWVGQVLLANPLFSLWRVLWRPTTPQASTLTYFSTCPFGQLTKKSTCPTQPFSCPKKLIKIVWNKILYIKPCMGHISGTWELLLCEYWRKSIIIGEKNMDLKRLTGRLKLRKWKWNGEMRGCKGKLRSNRV
jgi:hypothetical protein